MDKLVKPTERIRGEGGADIWTAINEAAASSKIQPVINMGQGSFGYNPPKFVQEAVQSAIQNQDRHQYAPTRGNLRLLKAVAARYSTLLKRELDYRTEVLISTGANEGLFCSIMAFVEPGDEVILLEPTFDIYLPQVKLAGGAPRFVPLKPASLEDRDGQDRLEWNLDFEAIESAMNSKTKAIILNSPHNPTGKVFPEEDLRKLAQLCIKNSVLVFSDEVYDSLSFIPYPRIATLSEEIRNLTITICSIGKTFYTTGWRIGFIIGPEHLISHVARVHRSVGYSTPDPLQEAAAIAYEEAEKHDFWTYTTKSFRQKLDRFNQVWVDLGLPYTYTDGAYYIIVDLARVKIPGDFEFPKYVVESGPDHMLSWFIVQRLGVAGLPLSAFYSEAHRKQATTYLRFAVCKPDDALDLARERLQGLREYLLPDVKG